MNVAEERAEALRREVPDWPLSAADRQALRKRLETRWRSNGPMVSLVFFGLTLVAVAALFGLLALLDMPKGWITAAICIATAEYLIRRAHLMGSGVESGLWLGGLCAWVFALPSEGSRKAFF